MMKHTWRKSSEYLISINFPPPNSPSLIDRLRTKSSQLLNVGICHGMNIWFTSGSYSWAPTSALLILAPLLDFKPIPMATNLTTVEIMKEFLEGLFRLRIGI
jgi:hypothetical protein